MATATVKTYDFLKARSAQALSRLIRKHQLQTGKSYKYQIYSDGDSHYAWFYGEVEIDLGLKAESVVQEKKVEEL
mgnify:FL=1